jgi:hypothetical protein
MTQPQMPQQVLIAQANGLANTERAFPLGAPPIPIAQGLLSIAAALPLTGLPIPGTTGLPFPNIQGLPPLGGTPILANLAPLAPIRPANGARGSIFPRTGLG